MYFYCLNNLCHYTLGLKTVFCGSSSWLLWVGLQRVLVVFPDNTHLNFELKHTYTSINDDEHE